MIIKGERAVLEKKAARILADSIQQIIAEQNQVLFAVPGGRSVANVLRKLEPEPVNWSKVHFFMVDERLVPLDHPESNFLMVASCVESFVDKKNLHPFPQNIANHKAALNSYNRLLQDYGGHFDLVLLSGGEDAHIASIFPDHETVSNDAPCYFLTHNSPKPPPDRVTASIKLIRSSQVALLLFFGAEKQNAFDMYVDEQVPLHRCPAKIVTMIPNHFVLTDVSE